MEIGKNEKVKKRRVKRKRSVFTARGPGQKAGLLQIKSGAESSEPKKMN